MTSAPCLRVSEWGAGARRLQRGRALSSEGHLKFSTTCEHEGTKSGTGSVGVMFELLKGTHLKATFSRTLQSVSRSSTKCRKH